MKREAGLELAPGPLACQGPVRPVSVLVLGGAGGLVPAPGPGMTGLEVVSADLLGGVGTS